MFAKHFILRQVPAGSTAIDLGGGTGFGASIAATRAKHVLLVDTNAERIAAARLSCPSNVEPIVGDAWKVLAARGPFDVALLLHFIEHVDEPQSMLEALRTQCGRIIVEVPDFDSDPLNELRCAEGRPCYSDADHVREFGRDQLEELLVRSGWTINALERAGGMLYAAGTA